MARLGETIDLVGHHLDGTARSVVLANDRFEIEREITAPGAGAAARIQFEIPTSQAADFPAGVYRVGARVQRAGEPRPRETNRLAMTLAPQITTALPKNVTHGSAAAQNFTLEFLPELRAGQRAVLVLGQQEYAPQPFAPPTRSLVFDIRNAPVGEHLARLRIDGIDSPIIDRSSVAPRFFDQLVRVT